MMSAVNNADERVNGISGDIEKTLSKAVSLNTLISLFRQAYAHFVSGKCPCQVLIKRDIYS